MNIQVIVVLALIAGAFVAGFFVGKRHGVRVAAAASLLKNTVGKL